MVRRILVFLALLFLAFFAWRWYDKAAADNFLQKIKNFSFKRSDNYTTTITNSDGTTTVIDDTTSGSTIWSSGLIDLIEDTMSDKTTSGSTENDSLIKQILTSETLETSVQQPVVQVQWLSGGVVINTGTIETISAQTTTSVSTPKVVNTSSTSSQTSSSAQLSEQDKNEMQKFLELFH